MLPKVMPTVLLTLAITGEYPMASNVGNVINEPEPTMVLMVPARKAAPTRSRTSRTDMLPGTVDCAWFRPGEQRRGGRQATGGESGRVVRVRARRCGALRARHAPEHDGDLRL